MGALLFITEDLVGLVELLEFVFGALVVGVAVGMVLHGQLAISLFDLIAAGSAFNPQNLIVVFIFHVSFIQKNHCMAHKTNPSSGETHSNTTLTALTSK